MSTTTTGGQKAPPPPKRLALFFDGTWNAADSDGNETNVTRLARAVRANSGDRPQIALYLRGVGTTGITLQKVIEGAFGDGVDENIRAGFMFLSQNYVPGDEIFLFGFSRGAFTARSLAGFIGRCGLLKRDRLGLVNEAWAYYRSNAAGRSPSAFSASHGGTAATTVNHAASIRFVGVWDTVGALGVPRNFLNRGTAAEFQFHDTSPSPVIEIGRHALAIDEKRDEFVPTLWTVPEGPKQKLGDIQQVWFAGVHSDVGGGYRNHALADIPLRWMADEAQKAGLDLDFESNLLPGPTATLPATAPQHDSRQGWSMKDRLTPTIRAIMGTSPSLGLTEWLYFPINDKGKRLATLNESLHPSVLARRGKRVQELGGDDDTDAATITYRPVNLP